MLQVGRWGAMVHAYHPVSDKSTSHVAGCEGAFVTRPLVQMDHGTPWFSAYHRAGG